MRILDIRSPVIRMGGRRRLPTDRCPETAALMSALQTYLGIAPAGEVQGIGGQIEWERLLELARAHRVTPLVYRCVMDPAAETVPPEVLAHLRQSVHQSTARDLALVRQLLDLVTSFANNGIPLITLKGPALSLELYGSTAVRNSMDLDLLVHERDLGAAADLLGTQGYQDVTPTEHPRERRMLMQTGCELHFRPKSPLAQVELHWRLAPSPTDFTLDYDLLWQRRRTIHVGRHPVPVLGVEDLLSYVCLHGTKHSWGWLILLCDLARLIQVHSDLAWPRVLAEVEAVGGKRRVAIGFHLIQRLLRVELPPFVQQWANRDAASVRLADEIEARLRGGASGDLTLWPNRAFEFASLERKSDRRRYVYHLARDVWTPNHLDFEFVHLPASLDPLYFGVRPVRYLWKYGSRALPTPAGERRHRRDE